LRRVLLSTAAVAGVVAAVLSPSDAASAAGRIWPPFVLVAGLLLVGLVAQRDGLFEQGARATDRVGGGGAGLLLALLGLVAVVTAVLNLDTSVAFLTPILVLGARRRGLDETPFLFGSLFMANAASLLLPGSNLTNLLVLAREHVGGAAFAARMAPAWAAAVVVTAIVLLVRYRNELRTAGDIPTANPMSAPTGKLGAATAGLAGVAVLVLTSPALAVLSIGVAAVAIRLRQRAMVVRDIACTVDVGVLTALFSVAVALGTLASAWSGPGRLMASAGRWESAVIGVVGAALLNNLPAAVLLSARMPSHPRALLIGLDLGPNLAVTGSLSALLWFHAAKSVGAQPRLLTVTRIGLILVPLSVIAALIASSVYATGRL